MKDNTFFETIKCFDGTIYNLNYHIKRVAKTIGLNIALHEYIIPPSEELLKCKIIYNKNDILDISYEPYKKREIKSFKLVFDDKIEYKQKSTNRDNIDKLFNLKDGADEIIIVKNGLITDTSIANIAIFDGINWHTPKIPLLNGTTRTRLIEEKIIIEKDIDIKMLKNAKKIAFLNAMMDMSVVENYSFL